MERESLSQENIAQALALSFVEKGLLSSDQIDVALREQRRKGISLEEALLTLGFITENALTEALATVSGHERIHLHQTLLDPSLKTLISQDLAERYSLLPLSLEDGILRVALADIYNLEALDFLRQHIPGIHTVIPLIASTTDIFELIDHYYGYDLSIPGLLQEIEKTSGISLSQDGNKNPTIRLVNAILMDAIKLQASDIHFEPEGTFMRLRYRIDGILSQICTFHSSYWQALCVRLKVLGEMNIAESRRPQNGRLTYFVGPREIDLRFSSHPTIHGENIVVRILDKNRSLLALDKLGYSPRVIDHIKQALQIPEGIFIVTGPTGCGKTTSLYSLLSYMNANTLNIMTLEAPVEYKLPFIRQSDIRDCGGMDFTEGVRSILRQDPDIILIGEIRDSATAQMALRASMTGHQVFSTLHTADALGAIHRLLDLGVFPGTLAGNLVAVVAQRLLRKLCSLCKEKREMTSLEASLLGLKNPSHLFSAKGCKACRKTGYSGRFAIAEVLKFDNEMNELLLSNVSCAALKRAALKKGYSPLLQEARQRVVAGDTSLEEALRIVNLHEEP
jgi:type II secretory ATPase GspE/PulE/Tfp pilus assembly ATPase PilB-like protein